MQNVNTRWFELEDTDMSEAYAIASGSDAPVALDGMHNSVDFGVYPEEWTGFRGDTGSGS